PQWSPDGRYVAFVGEGVNGQKAIFLRCLAGQSAKEVTPRFDNYENSDWPTWEPWPRRRASMKTTPARPPGLIFRQGVLPAFPSPIETLRLLRPGNAEGGQLWRVTAARVALRVGHLAWSPDGTRLALTLTPSATEFERYQVWEMNRDGTGARRVSPANGR